MKGSCLCGAVRYEISGPARQIVGCHCTQCRKTSGHYVAATQVADCDLIIQNAGGLRWYRSSDAAERGFCARCGASLFWRKRGTGRTSVMAGTLDGPTGLWMDRQLHGSAKGDYYPLPEVPEISQSEL
ncbi:MAG: GFA family protein [Pseudomonadota bacterium]